MREKSKIEFSFNPTKGQLIEIKNWLIEEMDSTGESFYSQWDYIESVFNKEGSELVKTELATISEDNQTIGFIIWSTSDINPYFAYISIAAIKTSHRHSGFGKKLVNKLIQKLINKNIYIVELECSPPSSVRIWRHLGFIDYPEQDYTKGMYKKLYKVIVPHSEVQQIVTANESLELCDNKSYDNKEIITCWNWNLIFKKGTRVLEKPIIHPCFDNDWRIRIKKENILATDEKVKYFSETLIRFNNFIFIKEIPELY